MAKVIMVQGTMSNAGKSVLAAGLCRVLSRMVIKWLVQITEYGTELFYHGKRGWKWDGRRSCRRKRQE